MPHKVSCFMAVACCCFFSGCAVAHRMGDDVFLPHRKHDPMDYGVMNDPGFERRAEVS